MKAKGYLKPVPGSPPRKPIYAYTDVTDAEYKARQEAIKASGTDKQVQRDYPYDDYYDTPARVTPWETWPTRVSSAAFGRIFPAQPC